MEIIPSDVNFETLLHGQHLKYFVPEYQRDYAWTADEIDDLLADVERAWKDGQDYFLGTVVLNKRPEAENHFEIIDGQQRIATATIIYSVIWSFAREFQANNEFLQAIERNDKNKQLAERLGDISKLRIVRVGHPNEHYLELNKKDHQFLRDHIQKPLPPLSRADANKSYKGPDNRVIKAKRRITKYLYDMVDSCGAEFLEKLDQFLGVFDTKVRIIRIQVGSDYDAYLLFESLNSKGLDLSIADLLKNKMLMSAGHDKEEILSNWDAMVLTLQDSTYSKPQDFIRFYWSAFQEPVTKNTLYKSVRKVIDDKNIGALKLSQQFKEKAQLFANLTISDFEWPKNAPPANTLEQYVAELNTLGYQICLPALLYSSSIHGAANVTRLAKSALSFLFRTITIGGNSVKVADDAFREVLKQLKDGMEIEAICKVLAANPKASDEVFRESFAEFTTENSGIARYILAKLHVHYTGIEQIPHTYHLEHILPQQPEKWVKSGFKGFDGLIRKEDLIFHIGNMTLLDGKINSSIQNDTFEKKVTEYRRKDANGGTTFPMTFELSDRYIDQPYEWTMEGIRNRAKKWADDAPKVWPLG